MTRNLKALGLALVAAFAFSAIVASGASAFTTFTAEAEETSLSASALTNQVFVTGESTVSCTEVSVDNATTGLSATTITSEPTYGGECFIEIGTLGKLTAQIDTHGCHYLFEAAGSVEILCPGTEKIEVTAKILGTFRKCLDVHGQKPTSSTVDYKNAGGAGKAMDVELESTVSGITYEKTGSCAFGTIEGNDASYTGKVTIKGSKAGEEKGVTVS